EKWNQAQPATARKIGEANSFADWIGIWFSAQSPKRQSKLKGEFENLRWRVMEAGELTEKSEIRNPKPEIEPLTLNDARVDKLRERLEWNYPHKLATERKAKSSVTALRRDAEELDDEAEQVLASNVFRKQIARTLASPQRTLNAAEIGVAHHKFL